MRETSEVGWYQSGYHDIRRYRDAAEACADFVYRETVSGLERRRMTPASGTARAR